MRTPQNPAPTRGSAPGELRDVDSIAFRLTVLSLDQSLLIEEPLLCLRGADAQPVHRDVGLTGEEAEGLDPGSVECAFDSNWAVMS